jgi:hypothetical protein
MWLFRKLLPKDSIDVDKIKGYIYLSPKRGFLMYSTSSYCDRVSIISIDLDNETYDFIGNFCDIPGPGWAVGHAYYTYNFCPENQTVFINKKISRTLFIFYLNFSSFEINSYRTIEVPENAFLFNLINGNLMFANFERVSECYFNLNNFKTVKDDNSLVEIENTEVRVELKFERINRERHRVNLFDLFIRYNCLFLVHKQSRGMLARRQSIRFFQYFMYWSTGE